MWAYIEDKIQAAVEHADEVVSFADDAYAVSGLERRVNKCTWCCLINANNPDLIPAKVGKDSPEGLEVWGSVVDAAYTIVTDKDNHRGAQGPA